MLSLRQATIEDLALYFVWANDPVVRTNSFNSDAIKIEDHRQWFAKRLADVNCYMYVLCEDGAPVGQIRFDVADGAAEIDYSIGKDMRGRGLGATLLEIGIAEMSRHGIRSFEGKVKPENVASGLAFAKAGFSEVPHSEYRIFVRSEPGQHE